MVVHKGGGITVVDPMSSVGVEASYAHCRSVARSQAGNFFLGMRLTPEPKRSAMYAVYAWMRAADDIVDEPGDLSQKRQELERFRDATRAAVEGDGKVDDASPIWLAVRDVFRRHPVPFEWLDDAIAGQFDDLSGVSYPDFDSLSTYCYRVAGTVGLICLEVWGYTGGETTRRLAEYRGLAFQLTNILRDLCEDAELGRVYLPADELDRFGVTPQMLENRQGGPGFERLVLFQAERAASYYEMSSPLESSIDPGCRATSWAMTRVYRGLLDRIASDPSGVLRRRTRLSRSRKLVIAAGAVCRKWRAPQAGSPGKGIG